MISLKILTLFIHKEKILLIKITLLKNVYLILNKLFF